ncbi:MAG: MFS transporter [Betaproteobacteria bacterium]|nr:MFS transporter [Betaproteobacteria bacterium]
MEAPPAARRVSPAHVRLGIALSLGVILSQFLRSSAGVIAPELTRDLALTPQMLGFANACFFIALGVVQVPVGILFDRVGVRSTYLWLTGIAVLGALLHANAESGMGLAVARFLMGVGCGASFMSVVMLCSRWFPPERLASAISVVFALSQVGILLAATPLAAATVAWGWRPVFVVTAAATVAIGAVYAAWVRDDPPGARPRAPQAPEDAPLAGLWRVFRIPDIGYVLAIHTFAYASVATIIGLWAGPYLADVHGLSPVERGNVLLAMGAAQVVGQLAVGPLDRVFDTRKWIVVVLAAASVATLAALALIEHPPLAVAVSLLVLLALVSQYPVMIVAHAQSLFPSAIAGRGVTTVNLAQVIGSASLPYFTGMVIGALSVEGAAYPAHAYRMAFAAIAAPLAIGLLFYLRAQDAKPSMSC